MLPISASCPSTNPAWPKWCRYDGLHVVATTWEQVVQPNSWQQHRLARLVEGAVLAIVDPRVSEHRIAADLGTAPGSGAGSWHLVADANQASSGADALLLLPEWPQFAALDWAELAPL